MGKKELEFKCSHCGELIGYLKEDEYFEYRHAVICLKCSIDKNENKKVEPTLIKKLGI